MYVCIYLYIYLPIYHLSHIYHVSYHLSSNYLSTLSVFLCRTWPRGPWSWNPSTHWPPSCWWMTTRRSRLLQSQVWLRSLILVVCLRAIQLHSVPSVLRSVDLLFGLSLSDVQYCPSSWEMSRCIDMPDSYTSMFVPAHWIYPLGIKQMKALGDWTPMKSGQCSYYLTGKVYKILLIVHLWRCEQAAGRQLDPPPQWDN